MNTPVEFLWAEILSEDMERITAAFTPLPPLDRQAILKHLRRMTKQEGYQPVQIQAAKTALEALGQNIDH